MSPSFVLPKIAVDEHGALAREDPQTKERIVFANLTIPELTLLKRAIETAPEKVESHCTAPVDGVDLMLSFQRDDHWFDWECAKNSNELIDTWAAIVRRYLPKISKQEGKTWIAPKRQIVRITANGGLTESADSDGPNYPASVWRLERAPGPEMAGLSQVHVGQDLTGKTLLHVVRAQQAGAPEPDYEVNPVEGGLHIAPSALQAGERRGARSAPIELPLPTEGNRLKLTFADSKTFLELHLLEEPPAGSLEIEQLPDRLPAARVVLAGPRRLEGNGKLSSPVLMKALQPRMSAIEICYEQAVRTRPELQGKGLVKLRVDAEGKVSVVAIEPASPEDKLPVDCVSQVLGRVRLSQAPVGGDVSFEVRLAFSWKMETTGFPPRPAPGRQDRPTKQ